MVSIAALPAETRRLIFSLLPASSRFVVLSSNSTVFKEWCAIGVNPSREIHNKVKEVKSILEYLTQNELKYPLMPEPAMMKFALATNSDGAGSFLLEAPDMWGLDQSAQQSEMKITEWMTHYGERFECPFCGWLALNVYNGPLSVAVDMLLGMKGEMQYYSSKGAIVITFSDAHTGIEGSCFATMPFIESDDTEEYIESDFDSDGPLWTP